jgi:hypothetical protein
MLTREEFQQQILITDGSRQWSVAVDYDRGNRLYLISNGGMGNTITTEVERFLPEIKEYIVEMILTRQLVRHEEPSLLLDSNKLVYILNPPNKNNIDFHNVNTFSHEAFMRAALLEKISTEWEKSPELRLMQLLINAINPPPPFAELHNVSYEYLVKQLNIMTSKKT